MNQRTLTLRLDPGKKDQITNDTNNNNNILF